MKELKAVLLDDADVKDKERVMSSLCEDADKECRTADIVVFRGVVVKNRYGDIDNT